MAYELFDPPFTLNWPAMSKDELMSHYAWFMAVIPRRLLLLEAEVQRTPHQEMVASTNPYRAVATWQADLSADSLVGLGAWLVSQVETRERSRAEAESIPQRPGVPVQASDILTDRTFSLAADVGIYLSQVLLKARPGLRWEVRLRDQTFVDYGRPILTGFAKHVTMNPVRIAVTVTQGIAQGTRGAGVLRELYNVWLKKP